MVAGALRSGGFNCIIKFPFIDERIPDEEKTALLLKIAITEVVIAKWREVI